MRGREGRGRGSKSERVEQRRVHWQITCKIRPIEAIFQAVTWKESKCVCVKCEFGLPLSAILMQTTALSSDKMGNGVPFVKISF